MLRSFTRRALSFALVLSLIAAILPMGTLASNTITIREQTSTGNSTSAWQHENVIKAIRDYYDKASDENTKPYYVVQHDLNKDGINEFIVTVERWGSEYGILIYEQNNTLRTYEFNDISGQFFISSTGYLCREYGDGVNINLYIWEFTPDKITEHRLFANNEFDADGDYTGNLVNCKYNDTPKTEKEFWDIAGQFGVFNDGKEENYLNKMENIKDSLLGSASSTVPPVDSKKELVYSGGGYTIYRIKLEETVNLGGWRNTNFTYAPVNVFSEGFVNAGSTYMNTDGKLLELPDRFPDSSGSVRYSAIGSGFHSGLGLIQASVNNRTRYAFVDSNGTFVFAVEANTEAREFSEGLAAVGKYDSASGRLKWGFIDTTGKLVIPYKYDNVGDFSEGLAFASDYLGGVQRDLKYIDNKGNEVIKLGTINNTQPEYMFDFSEGLALVCDNDKNKNGYIDKSGNFVFSFDVNKISLWGGSFNNGLARAYSYEKRSDIFIDKTGKEVFPTTWSLDNATDFNSGLAFVRAYQDNSTHFFYINTTGEKVISNNDYYFPTTTDGRLIQPISDYKFNNGFASVYVNNVGANLIDTKGHELLPRDIISEYYRIGAVNDGFAIAVSRSSTYYILEIIGGSPQSTPSTPTSPETPTPPETPAPPQTVTARPTTTTIFVNGVDTAFEAYLIDGSNYLKLRDIAYALNGTSKQFNVGWDGANNAINLTSDKPYTVVGGEMQGTTTQNQTATPTTSKIFLDGKEVAFTAYTINGNNFFRLRDVGTEIGFYVDYEPLTGIALISTNDYNNLIANSVIKYNKALAIEAISNAITVYGGFFTTNQNIRDKNYDLLYMTERGYYDYAYISQGRVTNSFIPSADYDSQINAIFAVKDIWVDGKAKKMINISIAGTQTLLEWANNFNYRADRDGLHAGFANNAKTLQNLESQVFFSNLGISLDEIITRVIEGSNDYLIFINGHSMGGAVANIYTHWLSSVRGVPDTALFGYTFASPLTVSYDYNWDGRVTPVFNILNNDDTIIWSGVNINNGFRFGRDIPFAPTQEFRNEYYGGYAVQEEVANFNVFDLIQDIGFDIFQKGKGAYYTARHEQKMYLLLTMRHIE